MKTTIEYKQIVYGNTHIRIRENKTKQQNKNIQYSIPTTKHIKNQQFETRCQHHNQNMRK